MTPRYDYAHPDRAEWEYTLGPDWYVRQMVPASFAPNPFHRLMQRLLLGIHWRRIP